MLVFSPFTTTNSFIFSINTSMFWVLQLSIHLNSRLIKLITSVSQQIFVFMGYCLLSSEKKQFNFKSIQTNPVPTISVILTCWAVNVKEWRLIDYSGPRLNILSTAQTLSCTMTLNQTNTLWRSTEYSVKPLTAGRFNGLRSTVRYIKLHCLFSDWPRTTASDSAFSDFWSAQQALVFQEQD